MNKSDIINNCKSLSENDKKIFIKARNIEEIQKASVFSQKGKMIKKGDYNVWVVDRDVVIYFINWVSYPEIKFDPLAANSKSNGIIYNDIFIDENKKLIKFQKGFFGWGCSQSQYIKLLCETLDRIQLIEITCNNNICDLGNDYHTTIQFWFPTFGHFQDEITKLADYCDNYSNMSKIIYPIIDHKPYGGPNYFNILNRLISKDKYINTDFFTHNKKILKLKNLSVITHRITEKTFHKFPGYSVNKLLDSVKKTSKKTTEKVFITRNIASHMPRNLSNQKEIEDYFIKKNFTVINPENIPYEPFINTIRDASIVVITWGGALTNMMYLKENTKVYILKSKSYIHENIGLFKKIIGRLNLKINIIQSVDNVITLDKLHTIELL